MNHKLFMDLKICTVSSNSNKVSALNWSKLWDTIKNLNAIEERVPRVPWPWERIPLEELAESCSTSRSQLWPVPSRSRTPCHWSGPSWRWGAGLSPGAAAEPEEHEKQWVTDRAKDQRPTGVCGDCTLRMIHRKQDETMFMKNNTPVSSVNSLLYKSFMIIEMYMNH